MTHIVDTLMALADEYADAECSDYLTGEASSLWYRENLRKALTQALAKQDAQPKGLFIDMITAQGPEFVSEMAKIGCVQHDCDECKSRAAQPVREPLTNEQIAMAWLATSDPVGLGGKFKDAKHVREFTKAIERAHGIGGKT
jgi:hypothetical protein